MACKNDLREIITISNPDHVFKVPNYCVTDPIFERNYDRIKEKVKDIEEKKI